MRKEEFLDGPLGEPVPDDEDLELFLDMPNVDDLELFLERPKVDDLELFLEMPKAEDLELPRERSRRKLERCDGESCSSS